MKTDLETLLKQCTPLPYFTEKVEGYALMDIKAKEGAVYVTHNSHPNDAIFLNHAANHLPKLVRAVEEYLIAQCQSERAQIEARDKLEAALRSAKEVEL
jgi:hypothetical protein